ncbi:hypothetical protein ACFVUQ_34390 [Streptomyces cyaneofuscatus]|uniref:hypothetical protein n=1 Tax=Streptomyces cyaneofuscatus TaxID=66883 RepID=UPI0036D87079
MSQGTTRWAMVTKACAGAGCRRRETARAAVAGTVLCLSCRDRLVRELRELPALYEECARRLDISADRERDRVSGGSLPGLPLNTAAVEARSAIVSVLASWSAAVAQERGIAAPPRVVARLAGFLLRHAQWLAAHTAAGELSREVAQLGRDAARVMGLGANRRLAIGDCVEEGCLGRLTATVRPDQPGVPAQIACDAAAGHRWLGHQWLELSRLLGVRKNPAEAGEGAAAEAGKAGAAGVASVAGEVSVDGLPAVARVPRTRWFSAADVSRLWNIPSGSVYRHASRQQWRRRSEQGRTYYHDADVHKTLSALRRTA